MAPLPVQGLLVVYLPVWWSMFSYMLAQRRKKLSSAPAKKLHQQ